MNSAEEKRNLRKYYAERRARLQSEEKDAAIARHFFARFSDRTSYFVYSSFRTEVGTNEILRGLIGRDKRVCVPKLKDGKMLAVPYTEELTVNRFGISEPRGGEDTAVEIACVPLLAVDCEGYRLGYGGGYYDRYFQEHPDVYRVGLCYGGQAVERLPHEETDVPLHAVVTEDGVLNFH